MMSSRAGATLRTGLGVSGAEAHRCPVAGAHCGSEEPALGPGPGPAGWGISHTLFLAMPPVRNLLSGASTPLSPQDPVTWGAQGSVAMTCDHFNPSPGGAEG